MEELILYPSCNRNLGMTLDEFRDSNFTNMFDIYYPAIISHVADNDATKEILYGSWDQNLYRLLLSQGIRAIVNYDENGSLKAYMTYLSGFLSGTIYIDVLIVSPNYNGNLRALFCIMKEFLCQIAEDPAKTIETNAYNTDTKTNNLLTRLGFSKDGSDSVLTYYYIDKDKFIRKVSNIMGNKC